MSPPTPQPENAASKLGPVRILVWIGAMAACACVFGHLMGTRIGGMGPSLFWLGLFTCAAAFALGAILDRLRADQRETLKPLFTGIGIGLLVAVLGLTTLEVLSIVKFPTSATLWINPAELQGTQRPHPQLGWAPSRNYVSKLDFPRTAVEVRLNSRGFRDIEQEKDPERPCVVIIGDSYPVGWGSEYEDSVTPRLRAVLPDVQFFNASWAGYAKDQIALSYSVLAKPLRPKVVLVMFMVRPGVDDSLPLYRGLRKPWFVLRDDKLEMKGLPIEFVTTADSNKRLYRVWESERITGPGDALRFLSYEFPRRYLATGRRLIPDFDWKGIDRDGLPGLNAVESAILADLERQIESDGARMIVGIAPGPEVYRGCRDPVQAMAKHVESYREIGIDPVDITPFVARDWEECHNQEFHPNAKGIDRILDVLAERVRSALR